MSSVCRICLAGNTNLNSLGNKQLLCCYEKLTNAKFDSDDARPRALCSFCYQKLLRCHTFSQMALTSENIFSHLYDRGLEVTHEYITEVNVKHRLSVVTTRFNIIDDNATNAGPELTIKDEPLLPIDIDIKKEVTSEPDQLLKILSFPEDSTKRQITFEEDISDQDNDIGEFLFQTHTDQFKLDDSSYTIKDAPLLSIDMKKELTTELYKLAEIVPLPEHSTKNRLTFEEDYSDQENAEDLLYNTHVEQTKPNNSKMPFSCITRDQIFYNKSKLISRERNWHSQFEGKQYTRQKHTVTTNMIKYKAIPIQKIKMTCHVCDEKFYYKGHLDSHMRTHSDKTFACNVCDKKFHRKHNLDRHMKIHDMKKPTLFTCNDCEKQFNLKQNIVRHMRIHMGVKPFACNVCDKKFHQKGDLVTHTRTHTGEKPFACNVCDKKFTRKHRLGLHIRTHTDEKFASKQFNLKQSLLRHMRNNMGMKSFSCNVCDKQFYERGDLVLHSRIHTGKKSFACNVCDKKFNRKYHLDRHMRIHDMKKTFLFSCNECEKQFDLKQNIVRHMRIHMGLKLFACNVCDTQFHQKGDLVVHMRYHSGEKPFACNVCDKKFNRKHRLVLHMRIHTGEKSFACNYCEKQYYLKQNLVRHIKTHMGEKLFACNLCDKKLKGKYYLDRHMRMHYMEEKPSL